MFEQVTFFFCLKFCKIDYNIFIHFAQPEKIFKTVLRPEILQYKCNSSINGAYNTCSRSVSRDILTVYHHLDVPALPGAETIESLSFWGHHSKKHDFLFSYFSKFQSHFRLYRNVCSEI